MNTSLKLADYFSHDPQSPSGLSWAKNIYQGRNRNILMFAKGDPCGSIHKDGHWSVSFRHDGNPKRLYCHRIIWELLNGPIPKGKQIDHIDGNRENNDVPNMRLVCSRVNMRNKGMSSRNTSGKQGVARVDNSNGYSYYAATWLTDEGKQGRKYFSINKLGEDEALRLATEYRNQLIETINQTTDFKYTDRHKEK
ncbi:hypothetical protein PMW_159 [Pseudomonas phage phiPMW]|uniref:HNH nuclease domain-containing protein n=1 Tax=Pseudomonas phage phiPMW TaxID=1815582 RepID=A0A1S5R1L5_9CAUD|nr:HNH endonuclease [Pseudomonas phage phiPMW]ANA49284.1 hypothetical protein PMW_159 [Pseudomonas phage phiPMW]